MVDKRCGVLLTSDLSTRYNARTSRCLPVDGATPNNFPAPHPKTTANPSRFATRVRTRVGRSDRRFETHPRAMSTLEKLLVLGVLILVGVILSISLFWNRPDPGSNGRQTAHLQNGTGNPTIVVDGNRPNPGGPENSSSKLPTAPSLDAAKPGPLGEVEQQKPVEAASAANPGSLIGNSGGAAESRPADMEKPVLLSRTVPSSFVSASPNPEFYVYRVQAGDTPRTVSQKLRGDVTAALAIDRASEGRPMVPGREILIPADVFQNMKAESVVANSEKPAPVKTGPGATPAREGAKGTIGAEKANKDVVSSPDQPVTPGSVAPAAKFTMYTVKTGDNLRTIARVQLKDERRWKEIKTLNQMKSDVIRDGQKIKLPALKQ